MRWGHELHPPRRRCTAASFVPLDASARQSGHSIAMLDFTAARDFSCPRPSTPTSPYFSSSHRHMDGPHATTQRPNYHLRSFSGSLSSLIPSPRKYEKVGFPKVFLRFLFPFYFPFVFTKNILLIILVTQNFLFSFLLTLFENFFFKIFF
jgi:hypothetical protein